MEHGVDEIPRHLGRLRPSARGATLRHSVTGPYIGLARSRSSDALFTTLSGASSRSVTIHGKWSGVEFVLWRRGGRGNREERRSWSAILRLWLSLFIMWRKILGLSESLGVWKWIRNRKTIYSKQTTVFWRSELTKVEISWDKQITLGHSYPDGSD